MLDLDRINNASGPQVADTALQVLDRVQDERKELQIVAIAAAFAAFARRHRADPAEVFRAASNILNSKFRDNPAFRALDLYLEHEIA